MRWLTSVVGAIALLASVSAAQAASIITNGSFEAGTLSNPFSTVGAGDPAITDWSVDSGSVDYIGNYWQAQDGTRSLDMSGGGAGAISQTFGTQAGQQYQVSFYVAANPDGPPPTKLLTSSVTSGSDTLASVTVGSLQAGSTHSVMGWVLVAYAFVADSSTATLSFVSQALTPFGPALDNVSVSAVPIPPALILFGTAIVGVAALSRRRSRKPAGLA